MDNATLKKHVLAIDKEVEHLIANADEYIDSDDWRKSTSKIEHILSNTSDFLRDFMLMSIRDCNVSPTCMFYGDINQTIYTIPDDSKLSYLPARRIATQIKKIEESVKYEIGNEPSNEAIDEAIAIVILEHFIRQTRHAIKASYQPTIQRINKPSTDDIIATATAYIAENPIY